MIVQNNNTASLILGSKNRLSMHMYQIVTLGFGISISGGVDTNSDTYSDVAVGAYLGGKSYILKSRPLVTLQVEQDVDIWNVSPQRENSNCRGPAGKLYHCVRLTTTLLYEGEGTPETFQLVLTFTSDRMTPSKRIKFLPNNNGNNMVLVNEKVAPVTLSKGIRKVVEELVYVKVNGYGEKLDVFSPLEVVTSYKQVGFKL